MKIFMYSDLHISKTSSILPLTSSNSKYTYRQNMIIETGKYLANIIDEVKPDVIINLGDTFDQHTITSYDIEVASEFFKCFKYINIPHIVLVGNHEMINYDYNAIKILSNIDNITVVTEPTSVDLSLISVFSKDAAIVQSADNKVYSAKIALLPYMEFKDILDFPDGDFLFSHIDIMGMKIRGDYELPEGISVEQLSKYRLVFNGHIHKPSIKGNIVNVGSISTHSFSDDNEAVPQCYLFDTETLNLQTFKPKMCPLFRKLSIHNMEELNTQLHNLDTDYKYVIQLTCPFEIKQEVREYLSNQDSVLAFRLNIVVSKEQQHTNTADVEIQSNIDIKKSFKEFLDTTELKYPKGLYLDILQGID